jgi:hypothetical protein
VWPQCWNLQGPRGLEQRDLRNLNLGDLKKGPYGGVSPTPQKKLRRQGRSLGRYSSIADSRHGVCFVFVFWVVTWCSVIEIRRRVGGTYCRVLGLACTLTLQMEAVLSSETVIKLHQNTRRHMPERSTLQISV